ncbi:class I adenylate-forming enzyme family protein [Plantactinospora sp. KBS50]|uniref:AMP-binding protein n=1 Tax=Plantactinospora sp. KBS50 TaxID=2024580 RepID=UPI000BAAB28E|nr:class I adenylate-forming enzyme family protein [Plantactinospora sp. KBS50]ASW56767.1 long-chain acyl-CoA synthetase [Plantactinospora sp. KBS50]
MSRRDHDRSFQIGLMFDRAAGRHNGVPVRLDEPLQLAPDRGVELTVGKLAELVDDLAARLWAAGVRPTERVAVYKTNNADIPLLACAVARIGAVPALLSPALPTDVAVELLRRLERPWLLTDAPKVDQAFGGTAPVELAHRVLLSAGREIEGTVALADFAGAPRREPVQLHPRQPSLITHSSGTTDVPKLAVHCGDSLWHRFLPQKTMAWPIRRRETAALCMTYVHSRFYNALRVFLDYGNPMLIATDHEPSRIGPLFVQLRPGYVETHPNTYIEWEELRDAPHAPLSSVLVFGGTFDAMHPRTIQRLLGASRRRFPLFVQLYGQSETGPVCARWFTRRGASGTDARCIGIPLPGFVRMRVTGDDGRRVGRGRPGHLEVRVRSRIITYLGEQRRYADVLNDGWWRMGDMGFRGRFGEVYLLDREIDRIESMQSNLEAEDLLMSRLNELREVAIVAGPNGEPVPVVCVRDERPLDLERWRLATADLPGMAEPVQLPFDQVPRTSTWKVQRPKLVRMLAAGLPHS